MITKDNIQNLIQLKFLLTFEQKVACKQIIYIFYKKNMRKRLLLKYVSIKSLRHS